LERVKLLGERGRAGCACDCGHYDLLGAPPVPLTVLTLPALQLPPIGRVAGQSPGSAARSPLERGGQGLAPSQPDGDAADRGVATRLSAARAARSAAPSPLVK